VVLAAVGGVVISQDEDSDRDDGGRGTTSQQEQGPEEAIRRFVTAGNCQDLAAATTRAYQSAYMERAAPPEGVEPADDFVALCEQIQSAGTGPALGGEVRAVGIVSQAGDRATVRATSTEATGEELSLEYTAAREDGLWKVDSVDAQVAPEDVVASGPGEGESESPSGSASGGTVMPDDTVPGDFPPPDVEPAERDVNGNGPADVVNNFAEASTTHDCELVQQSVTEDVLTHDGTLSMDEAMEDCRNGPSVPITLSSVTYVGIYSTPPDEFAAEGVRPDSALVMAQSDAWDGYRDFWLTTEDGMWRIYQ
jgi:hypothetical protein